MAADRKSERRSFVRRNHPDVGGDPEIFQAGMKAYDEPPTPPAPITTPPAPKAPATDRMARGLGRLAAKAVSNVTATANHTREAYREGRDTDRPI
jgi:hypothetical protein